MAAAAVTASPGARAPVRRTTEGWADPSRAENPRPAYAA